MIFGDDRQSLRRQYVQAWRKLQQQEPLQPLEQLIADVVQEHPEYHRFLADDNQALLQDFSPEQGLANPFLHMGLHIALREQVASDRPTGIREIVRRILPLFKDSHAAEHAILEVLGETLWEAQRTGQLPDEQVYLEKLRRLI